MKLFPMIPSSKSWFLSFVLAVMVLVVTLSHLFDQTKRSPNAVSYNPHLQPRKAPSKGPNAPPVLAYWILGTRGENERVMRLLKAIYHPRNHYLLQLDSSASHYERLELSSLTQSEVVFEQFGNVDVVGKSYAVNPMAASGLAAVLHAAALLLRLRDDWDWFVPLSTSDYPILPQDVYCLKMSFPWDSAMPLPSKRGIVDPSLYLKKKASIYYAKETREKPDAFELFGGSPWMVLTRGFLEHCVNGLDNLPRKLLMYFNNVVFPLGSYFQTVLCNTPHFQNTILVNNDLRHTLHTHPSILAPAIFATPFRQDDPRMQHIDEKLLNRGHGRFVPGKWCNPTGLLNQSRLGDTSDQDLWGDIDVVQPTNQGIKLQEFFLRAVREKNMASSQCRSYVMHDATEVKM
ncbi:beta-glucuronosyltransferase GlcAT14A-like [Salvia splendens]|uniref:beta-glucuronosyltransferase GlcAT14A-like n=1 Tax=Salvia splendens TaxID=180675 RepID=UPI0011042F14|nr:beta-glucuronosyltransferase GlcAT14A-like [Salvia splendens]